MPRGGRARGSSVGWLNQNSLEGLKYGLEPRVGGRADREDSIAATLEFGRHLVDHLLRIREVELADGDDHRAFEEPCVEAFELGHQSVKVPDRIAFRIRVDADHMQKDACAFDVLQEPEAQAGALGRAFDDARDVCDHEGSIHAQRDDAQVRDQRGERIVGDFGSRFGHRRDESALSDVWKAYDPDVGQKLELEADLTPLTGLAWLGATWSSIVRGRELDIAASATTSSGDDQLRARVVEVGELCPACAVIDLGADRHLDPEVGTSLPELVLPATVLATLRAHDLPKSKVEERGHAIVRFEDHASAPAPVSPRRTSKRHEFFPSKRDATVAAVACHDLERHLVDEIHARHYVEGQAGATDLALEQISKMRTLPIRLVCCPLQIPCPHKQNSSKL